MPLRIFDRVRGWDDGGEHAHFPQRAYGSPQRVFDPSPIPSRALCVPADRIPVVPSGCPNTPPAHTSRASRLGGSTTARAGPLSLDSGSGGRNAGRNGNTLTLALSRQGRGDWTTPLIPRTDSMGEGGHPGFRLVGVVCGGGWTAGMRRRR